MPFPWWPGFFDLTWSDSDCGWLNHSVDFLILIFLVDLGCLTDFLSTDKGNLPYSATEWGLRTSDWVCDEWFVRRPGSRPRRGIWLLFRRVCWSEEMISSFTFRGCTVVTPCVLVLLAVPGAATLGCCVSGFAQSEACCLGGYFLGSVFDFGSDP